MPPQWAGRLPSRPVQEAAPLYPFSEDNHEESTGYDPCQVFSHWMVLSAQNTSTPDVYKMGLR
uniref:Uncharacterized protein n=1 Tax=Bionectria ochroleuca TaxID=29856 RepID=A0A8H7NP91_BIOOC